MRWRSVDSWRAGSDGGAHEGDDAGSGSTMPLATAAQPMAATYVDSEDSPPPRHRFSIASLRW